jgi:hypothetical protein
MGQVFTKSALADASFVQLKQSSAIRLPRYAPDLLEFRREKRLVVPLTKGTSTMNKVIFAIVSACLLAGCAEPARVSEMVPAPTTATLAPNSPIRNAITVGQVSGGTKTNPMWTSQVDNDSFAGALRSALSENQLAATATPRYRLDAALQELHQPFAGFDMTVRSTVQYTLTDLTLNRPVFDKQITDKFTATVSDAFVGVKRLELANEGSIKTNIGDLVNQLIAESASWPMTGDKEVSFAH